MSEFFSLTALDYIVAGILLLAPLGIGILFAVKDRKRATREEYLVGGRQMYMIPVTLSLFVTFQSAISLMGIPSDVYTYGAMAPLLYLGFSFSYVVGYFVMVPVMYPLKLTSVYEYLHRRYQSQGVRMASTIVGMVQTVFYMAVALLSPALALQAACSFPLWMSVIIVGSIGTVYTAIGGIKSVVWTDTLQIIILVVGILTIIIKGCLSVGGLAEVATYAQEGGRASFDVVSPDPRTRHSWWGMVIGGMFTWLINVFNQSSVQRVSAMRTLRDAKVSFLLNIPMCLVQGTLLLLVGWVMYAYFHLLHCDPTQGGFVSNRNQLLPFFVLHSLRDVPGMAGLFMAAVFSSSLSTISSGINGLAANTVEDFLKRKLRSKKETTATLITKTAVFIYGMSIVGLAYGAGSFKGPVTQMALTVIGAFGSPVLGIFLIGCIVPWANKYGALIGGLASLGVNLTLGVCNKLYGRRVRTLPPVSVEMCDKYVFSNSSWFNNEMVSISSNLSSYTTISQISYNVHTSSNGVTEAAKTLNTLPQGDAATAFGHFFNDISYEWYGFIGTVVSVAVGLFVSYLTRNLVKSQPHPGLISPVFRRFWYSTEPEESDKEKKNLIMAETYQRTEKGEGVKSFEVLVSPPCNGT